MVYHGLNEKKPTTKQIHDYMQT